jgi:feruloyl esterase
MVTAALAGLALFSSGVAGAQDDDTRAACQTLAALDAADFRVETAQWIEAASQDGAPTPAHCLFQVVAEPRPSDIDGVSFGTGIELRLPLEWNGRFLFQGGGGMNGALNRAVGAVRGFPSALSRGFAVVSTDGGHRGRSIVDSSFAVDQQARLDFAYRAVQRTTEQAKVLISRYYGRGPDYSYFMGCSTGGREAMIAAQRLPREFDGIVAGHPAFNLTRIAANQIWSLQAVTRIAPRNENGEPALDRAFSDSQLRAVADAVTGECDALDGLADGMINDFQACGFDPGSLRCNSAADSVGGQCLSDRQAAALNDIFGGARNSQGEPLYGSFPFDTGITGAAWRSMHLGSATRPPANASLGRDTLRLFALTPPNPDLDPLTFDFDNDMAATAETAAINDAVATLHGSFAGHGGKLLLYHGLSDQGMAAGALIDWYDKLTPRDSEGPQSWARLFFVPGMTHCGGGSATDTFDMLTAIQSWVEKDEAPDRIIAFGDAFEGLTRPLCPYPLVARYDSGDPDEQQNFSCR